MAKIRKRLQTLYKIELELTPAVGDAMAARCQQISIVRAADQPDHQRDGAAGNRQTDAGDDGVHAKYHKLIVDADAAGEFTYTLT